MFKIDFYESGKGETTILTFPDESIGVLDAYPSAIKSRPDIISLLSSSKIRFICMSHPHDDHARDLPTILEHSQPEQFWHTVQATERFFYGLTEYDTFNSPLKQIAEKKQREAAEALINLFSLAAEKQITQIILSSSTREMHIAGVDIYFLAPDVRTVTIWNYNLQKWLERKISTMPDYNDLSSIIAFHYGNNVFIHGGDALAAAWMSAYGEFKHYKIKTASLMKIPHHGAKNSLFIGNQRPKTSYMRFFVPSANLICFGNTTHPDRDVWQALSRKSSNIYFLLNQYRAKRPNNPLQIPGGRLARVEDLMCNSHIHAEWGMTGGISITGENCCMCDMCKISKV